MESRLDPKACLGRKLTGIKMAGNLLELFWIEELVHDSVIHLLTRAEEGCRGPILKHDCDEVLFSRNATMRSESLIYSHWRMSDTFRSIIVASLVESLGRTSLLSV
jgi:hypothetical protein